MLFSNDKGIGENQMDSKSQPQSCELNPMLCVEGGTNHSSTEPPAYLNSGGGVGVDLPYKLTLRFSKRI